MEGININISFAAGGNEDGRWCQVSELLLGALLVIEELKSPTGRRGFAAIGSFIIFLSSLSFLVVATVFRPLFFLCHASFF